MARPKAFDRDAALKKAMRLFWAQGYEATSTEEVARAMGIGRQSMYDTYGDKHSIYLEALRLYRKDQGQQLEAILADPVAPLRGIETVLLGISSESQADRLRGCMMVNATTELAHDDAEVQQVVQGNACSCEVAFENAVLRAQKLGQLPAERDPRRVGRFLFATLMGLRVMARGGASADVLRDVAQVALGGIGATEARQMKAT